MDAKNVLVCSSYVCIKGQVWISTWPGAGALAFTASRVPLLLGGRLDLNYPENMGFIDICESGLRQVVVRAGGPSDEIRQNVAFASNRSCDSLGF